MSLGPRGFERSPSQDAYVPCELHAKPRTDLVGNQLSDLSKNYQMVQSSYSREFEITVDKLFVIDTISFR